MSIKPILFNAEEVRATLDGRKTAKRLVVTPPPVFPYCHIENDGLWYWTSEKGDDDMMRWWPSFAKGLTPPYRPGDILYVRETWANLPVSPGGHARLGGVYYYKADGDLRPDAWRGSWSPSIHMPREAARIWLQVTDVRAERLRDITDDGAKAEGARYTDFWMYQPSWKASLDGGKTFHPAKPAHHPGWHMKDVTKPEQCYPSARGTFANLWDSTTKPADRERYGWAADPWVWVISFERCEKPEAADGA